jgi:hypothetical protein
MSSRRQRASSARDVVFDEAKWRARTLELATKFGLPETHPDYVGFEVKCWKCSEAAPYFLWPGIREWVEPPRPAPPTLRRRFSKTISESYPSNGCIRCDALFGDWFLFDVILDYLEYDEAGELVDRFVNAPEPPLDETTDQATRTLR